MLVILAYTLLFTGFKADKELQSTDSRLDNVCMYLNNANVTQLNERIKDCGQYKQMIPTANAVKAVEAICNNLQSVINCFQFTTNYIKTCLNKNEIKYFNQSVQIFSAGRKYKCVNNKKSFQELLSTNMSYCMEEKKSEIEKCNQAFELEEPWVDLSSLRIPVPKDPYSHKECERKALWISCIGLKLEKCKKETAANFYKGFYTSMMMASPCKKFSSEYPTLAFSAVMSMSDNVALKLTLGLYCVLRLLSTDFV